MGLSLAVQGEDEQKTLFVLVTGPDTDNAVQLIAKNFQNYAVKGATA